MPEVVEALSRLLTVPKPLSLVGLAIVCLNVALVAAISRFPRRGGNR